MTEGDGKNPESAASELIDRWREPLKEWLAPLVHLSNNLISFTGVLLTTTGGVSWLFALPVFLTEGAKHPYLGILVYLFLPGVFFFGLALMPVGMYFRFRRDRKLGRRPADLPPLSWRNPAFRRLVSFVFLATGANVVIAGHFTYSTVEYMDSASFCGELCHSVMAPEFAAYQESSHYRVSCVDCHIGAGASWFVRSKLSGVGQVFAIMLDNHRRPIPAPVHNLRPAQETCETCHWPQHFSSHRLRIMEKFADDEENTRSTTVLLMRIGGGSIAEGIHGAHLAPGVEVEYLSDPSRQQILWVRYTASSGVSTEYAAADWNPDDAGGLERRRMDCVDCHNRPTHAFLLPERAVDEALAAGRLDPSLPFIKKQGVEILRAEYASAEEAELRIPAKVEEFYRESYPDSYRAHRVRIREAGETLVAVYKRNVFPEMKVTWGTYPNNIGHTDFPGCFRCHDDMHASAEGETISQDCASCHEILAYEESEPEILTSLGVAR